MPNESLYTALLQLESPWYIDSINIGVMEEEVHVIIGHHSGPLPCPQCGVSCPVHDHVSDRTWRHLDLWQCKTWLHCALPRTDCPEHGVHRITIPWAESNSRFTMMMESKVIATIHACKTVQGARKLLRLSWDETRGIMERAVCRGEALQHRYYDQT